MKTIFGKCDFGTIIMIGIDNERAIRCIPIVGII